MPTTGPEQRYRLPMNSPAPAIDHTLLNPQANTAQFDSLCEEAVEWGFAAVCVPPVFVQYCSERVYGAEVKIATVIGFPFGYSTSGVKVLEAERAILSGADELDMVMAYGAALDNNWDYVEADIRAVVDTAGAVPVKVILECSALDDARKRHAVETAVAAGAHFVKTSTGYGASGATVEDVRLLHDQAAGRASVKASGGIRELNTCMEILTADAIRIGTSSGVRIMQEWQAAGRG